jgi:hypothetical protein
MYLIQSVINFFIHSGTGQAALTMPIMAPLADLVGVTRQTAILAFQLGELSTPMIPTSGITVGVLALARVPWLTWAKWMIPLQLIYLVLAMALLVPPVLMNWATVQVSAETQRIGDRPLHHRQRNADRPGRPLTEELINQRHVECLLIGADVQSSHVFHD